MDFSVPSPIEGGAVTYSSISDWRRSGRTLAISATVCLMTALSIGCSPGANSVAAPSVSEVGDLRISRDVAYGRGARRGLDVYALRQAGRPRPVIVYLYGGGWVGGAKADFAYVGESLARQGFVVMIPDYRIFPQARWPNFIQDNALALRWARDHAAEYGGDPSRLVLMGHSAGAYAAASLVADPRWLKEVGLDAVRDLHGVIALSGVYIIVPETLKEFYIFGPKWRWPDLQPFTHLKAPTPPMLLGIGDHEEVVEPEETMQLAELARKAGGRVKVVVYPGVDHAGAQGALASPPDAPSAVMSDIVAFIETPGR